MDKKLINYSRFLSMVLRHKPEVIKIELDQNGWCEVEELLYKMNIYGKRITFDILEDIVANDNKQRYSFNEDKTKIRANQGHSIEVDLQLKECKPPDYLYHGTVGKYVNLIKSQGIKKMSRQHVHLSKDIETAVKVGNRRGKPIILKVAAEEMFKNEFKFYLSKNNVWLTDHVPSEYIIWD